MSIFCITGFSKASAELAESLFLASGMSTHLPLERDPAFNVVRWHERVTSTLQQANTSDSESLEKPTQPSRLWQQLAIDLMLANMNSAHWGWAHTGAVQWLEFWSQLEPEIRFVLVCEDRHSLICRLVEEGQTPERMSGHLALWAQSHQEMLRFHLRNPAKSILVWDADVRTNPSALMQSVQENWQTQLGNPLAQTAPSQALKQPTALLQHIAAQILREHAQTAPLDHELQALLGPSPCPSASQSIATADYIEVYGQLKDRVDLQSQLVLAQQNTEEALASLEQARVQSASDLEQEKARWQKQLRGAQQENALALAQLSQLQEELKKAASENQDVQEKIKAESAAKQAALNKLAEEQKTSTALQKQKDELSAGQQDALTKNKDLQEESDLLLTQLRQVQEELEKYFLKHQEAEEKIKAESAAKQNALNKLAEEQKTSTALRKQKDELSAAQQDALAKNKALQEKSSLLSAQLQQVQEELKKSTSANQDAQVKIKAESAAKQDALNKLAEEQKTSDALQKQKDELSAAQQQALAKNKDLQEESDLLFTQLQQVQEDLKKSTSANQDVQVKIKAETTAKQDALNKLAEEQKTSTALRKQKDELSAAQQQALAKNKDLQEESDLLLTQLHQVQEELEKYYLQNKDRQIEVQALQDRWLRAVQSHPELLDFEDLQILSESKTELTAHWRINQLQVDGVMKGPFEFKTLVENGVAGLVFTKDAKGLSPVLRWPQIAAKDTQLTVIPVKGQDDPQKRSGTILQMGTSDWHLVQLLTEKLIKALGSTGMMGQQMGHGQTLLAGLKAQQQILEKLPTLLRFDAIELFGQQNTDLKSVIGLRLNRADLQGLRADPFKFQIQLNLASSSAISSAHLIFDEKSVGNPFQNWKQNVKSSAGQAVMALQLGPQGWNPQTWHELSTPDQEWLQNTVRLLPFMLSTLQSQGVKLTKGWSFWGNAVTELVNWTKLSVGAPQPEVEATDAAPSELPPPDAKAESVKAPLKASAQSKQAKLKSSKPVVTAKVAPKVAQKPMVAKLKAAQPVAPSKAPTKATQKPTAVKATAAKPIAKAKQAAKVLQKTTAAKSKPAKPVAAAKLATKAPPKPMPAKSKAAKPAVKVKAADKVAGKAKRRTA